MASAVTNFGAQYWLQVAFGLSPAPTNYWLALCSGEPGTDCDGDVLKDIEPDDPAYIRRAVGTGTDDWTVNAGFLINANSVPFGFTGADWGDIDHYVLCTSQSSGEIYAYGALANPQYVEADQAVSIAPGSIVLAFINADAPIAV